MRGQVGDSVRGCVFSDLFGKPWARDKLIEQAAKQLNLDFSKDQVKTLQTIGGPLSVVDCVAGAGKTVILQALLCWLYEVIEMQQREDVVVTYCAPTQELVRKVRAQFQALLPAQSGLEHVVAGV